MDVWVYDLARNVRTRVTYDAALERGPVWSPDGERLAYSSIRKLSFSETALLVKPVNATGNGEPRLSSAEALLAESWSPDGRYIAYASPQVPFVGNPGADVWVLPLFGDSKPFTLAQTRYAEAQPNFSPDGRWVAYTSAESGRSEVYVTPFPGSSRKWPVSEAGGMQPRWRRDGAEIFYVIGGRLMAAAVNGRGATFEVGAVRPLFSVQAGGVGRFYDVSADGQRFLVNAAVQTPEEPITLVVNWPADLKK